jgi:hypothetical protein
MVRLSHSSSTVTGVRTVMIIPRRTSRNHSPTATVTRVDVPVTSVESMWARTSAACMNWCETRPDSSPVRFRENQPIGSRATAFPIATCAVSMKSTAAR